MNKRSKLLEMLSSDPFQLLRQDHLQSKASVNDSDLISSFEEIQNFVENHGRIPESNLNNIIEYMLFARLNAIRSDPKKIKALKKYDFTNLLNGLEIKEISVEDIIADDSLGLLEDDIEKSIFSLKHVQTNNRIKPDFLSRRKVCKDFSKYKEMFQNLHEELAHKKRILVRYSSADLNVNHFYVLDGILVYLKSIEGNIENYEFQSGERERFDGRTICIFDNGTESNMLFRSLDKAMRIDGYCISQSLETPEILNTVNESDVLNGYIYVLKSKNPNVQHFPDLYKIGHTTGLVSERIKNARNEATYMFSDVDVVATFRCFNIGSYNLEQTIHDFFSQVKLEIELHDNFKKMYKPREWFNVEFNVISEAIQLILTNKISSHEYIAGIKQIIRKH